MRAFRSFVLLAVLLSAPAAASRAEDPRVPSYLLLRAPAQTPHGRPYYPGRGYDVKPHAYAYGWFGATPRSHWHRHTGYYSGYLQWSRK
ncbi:MAG: hypothetical protein MUF48_01285 [Pirellulaceae bacterium]|jgi:hypothetical protein|nr:hypothetical protein [Pirellulaceae bacterium]